MTDKELALRIARALDSITPADAFDKITAFVSASPQKGGTVPMTVIKKKSYRHLLAIAVALVLLAGAAIGFFRYRDYHAVDTVIDIDVNPSIELAINKNDRVLQATAFNADGETVLNGLDLKNTDLNVAVNAVIGSMVQNGYILDDTSGILVTVQNADKDKAARIHERIDGNIDSALAEKNIESPVLSQTLSSFEEVKQFAEKHGISYGKAALIYGMAQQEPSLDVDELAGYPAYVLAGFADRNNIDLRDILDYDEDDSVWENVEDALDEDYDDFATEYSGELITPEQAKEIALEGFSVSVKDVLFVKAELDAEDGIPVYELEFAFNGAMYEYEINAITGQVIEEELDDDLPPVTIVSTLPNGSTTSRNPSTTTTTTIAKPDGLLKKERAKEIVLNHCGGNADNATFTKLELDQDDNKPVYEIEFVLDGYEYEYEIDARTGDIRSAEKEKADRKPTASTGKTSKTSKTSTTKSTTKTQGIITNPPTGLISEERVKEIALADRGDDVGEAKFTKIETDMDDDGVPVYEIEFVLGDVEYDYEIDARTGDILSVDKEPIETRPSKTTTAPTTESPYILRTLAINKALLAIDQEELSDIIHSSIYAHLYDEEKPPYWRVEFHTDDTRWEIEVDAMDGNILSNKSFPYDLDD